ncbi:MAG: GAF domain-containing protein [Chloroflexi bacterium]|nr:GAF domain-containing protein [Chloroflexota bacterium]
MTTASHVPETSHDTSMLPNIQLYRQQLLGMFINFMGFGAIPILISFLWRFWAFERLRYFYLAFFALTIALLVSRRYFGYRVQVTLLMIFLHTLAVYSALYWGHFSGGHLFFLASLLIGSLFLGMAGAIANWVVTAAVHTIVAYGTLVRHWSLVTLFHVPEVAFQSPTRWIGASITFIFGASTLVVLIHALQRRLETSVEDSVHLTQILDHERQRLVAQERRLQRRVRQIRAVSEIINSLSEILDPEQLVWEVVDQIQSHFALYYVGIFTVDPEFEYAILQAGSGEAGRKMVQEGYRLPLGGTSLVAWAITQRKMRVARDTRQDPGHFPNPFLPYTRSEVAIPLIARGEILGAITIQSDRPNAFDEEDLRTLQTLANSVALALANAQLFQRFQAQLREIEALHRRLFEQAWVEQETGEIVAEARGEPYPNRDPYHTEELTPVQQIRRPLLLYGHPVGELQLEVPVWSDGDEEILEGVLTSLANSLMVARLLGSLQSYVRREEIRYRLAERFSEALDFDLLARVTLQGLQEVFGFTEGWLRLDVESLLMADVAETPFSREGSSPSPAEDQGSTASEESA